MALGAANDFPACSARSTPASASWYCERAVSGQQHLFPGGDEIGDEVVDRADLVVGHALHAAGDGAVPGVEHLAPAGVEHRRDEPARVPERVRHEVEAGDADDGDPERLGHRLGGGHADPEAGEQAGPEAHRDRRESCDSSTSSCRHRYSIAGREVLGVAPAVPEPQLADDVAVGADRHAHLGRGRVEAEEHHVELRVTGSSAGSSRRAPLP